MDFSDLFIIATAVIIGNAISFAFFMGALHCSKIQKEGVKEEDVPLWIWLCLLVAPLALAYGFSLVK